MTGDDTKGEVWTVAGAREGIAYQMKMVSRHLRAERCRRGQKALPKLVRLGSLDAGQTGELLEPMARAARMVEGHLEGILAHWTRGLTTAFMEGLNSLFSAVKRKARGYRTVEYMTAMLYLVAGKLTLPCH